MWSRWPCGSSAETGGVSQPSRCVLPQDAHRCCSGQDKGGTHWPPFQKWQISCNTWQSLAERVAESWHSGCCTTCRAHWAWVWSNPWQMDKTGQYLQGADPQRWQPRGRCLWRSTRSQCPMRPVDELADHSQASLVHRVRGPPE